MRTKAVPLRAPRKTDAWRAKRVVFPARTFPAADLPRATSRQVQFDSPQPATTAAAGPLQSVAKKKKEKGGGRRRLARVCKDKPGNDATERAAPDKPIPSKPAATSTPSTASTASSPPPTARGPPPRTERTSSQSRSSAGASPPRAAPVADLPPDLHRLVHPSSAVLGEPTDKPGRGAYRSCDPCSKRREKCDRYTVCGSCIIHSTQCVWSKCRPLFERSGTLPGIPEKKYAERRAELEKLRRRVEYLAPRVGLKAAELLEPQKLERFLRLGLPSSGS